MSHNAANYCATALATQRLAASSLRAACTLPDAAPHFSRHHHLYRSRPQPHRLWTKEIMKSSVTSLLFLLLLLLPIPRASAYYDPGVQRWVNRDPINEPGFEALPRRTGAVVLMGATQSPSLFTFVGNRPVRGLDTFGLQMVGLPFPSGGAVNGQTPGTIGGRNYGNFPDCRGSAPPRLCAPLGARSKPKPSGKMVTKECPCTGTLTVQCYRYDTCDLWSFGTTDAPKRSWTTHEECPCPEYSTF